MASSKRTRSIPARDPAAPTRVSAAALVGMVMLVAFAVYAFTLAPGVPAGDSGELISAAATGGVAHPPGYPLYTMLGHAWIALVRAGSVAWRMNLFSALCAALAVGVLAGVVQRLTRSAPAAAIAGALFAFSPPLWKSAVVAEVFALNALFAALALDAFTRLLVRRQPGNAWPLLGLWLLTGLLVAHHHTLVLLMLPLDVAALWLCWRAGEARPVLLKPRTAVACGVALTIGLLPLAWIPWAAARHPALSWGDVQGVRDLLRLLLRVDYGTFRLDPLSAGHVATGQHVGLYLASVPADLGLLGLALLALGLIACARWPALGLALAAFAVLQGVFFTRVGFPTEPLVLRAVVERFYVLPGLALALVAGLGAAKALAWLPVRARGAAGALLVLAAVAIPLRSHGARISQRGDRAMQHLAEDVLASVPKGGVLFVQGDVFHNSLAYLQLVEHRRPDVTVVDQELMSYDWYVRALRRRLPDLLPPFTQADRLTLADGRVIEGAVLDSPIPGGVADSLDVLTLKGHERLARVGIATRAAVPSEGLFMPARAGFRRSWLSPPRDDRYSGLPPTRNVRWIEHLAGRRPVAFLGLKDDSWALRAELIPTGLVLVAHPLAAPPTTEERAAETLRLLAAFHLEDALASHDAWSFEAAERGRLADFANRAAVLLCQPGTVSLGTAHPGLTRLGDLIARAEADPTAEPLLLRAAGVLRLFHPRFQDAAKGTEDLRRYLASGAAGPEADEALAWLGSGAAR